MAASHFVFQGTQGNFSDVVLGNSCKGPVLVNFWAPWAGPCIMLKPVLVRLVEHYGGRLLLVEVNTDEQKPLARGLGVVSIPYLKLFRNRRVVYESRGAQGEATLRRILDRYTGMDLAPAHAEALRCYKRGDVESALRLFARAALENPDNVRVGVDHAKVLLGRGRARDAEAVLNALPVATQHDPPIAALLAHARFARAAAEAPSAESLEARLRSTPDDCTARFQLSALKLFGDDYEGAMQQLLEILRQDRGFADGAARAGLLAVIDLLGKDSELGRRYRSFMADALG